MVFTNHCILCLISALEPNKDRTTPFFQISEPNKKQSVSVPASKRGAEPFHSHNLKQSHSGLSDS
jgi:hypothetical protein